MKESWIVFCSLTERIVHYCGRAGWRAHFGVVLVACDVELAWGIARINRHFGWPCEERAIRAALARLRAWMYPEPGDLCLDCTLVSS